MEQLLAERTRELMDARFTIRSLLLEHSNFKQQIKENVSANLVELILPQLDLLSMRTSDNYISTITQSLKSNIASLTTPFSVKLTNPELGMTPREIEVANYVSQGKSNKDIAMLLSLSTRTVECYRDKIRGKLGIKNSRKSLSAHLRVLLK